MRGGEAGPDRRWPRRAGPRQAPGDGGWGRAEVLIVVALLVLLGFVVATAIR